MKNLKICPENQISESQRKCLSHILRNCEQAIEWIMTAIDDPYAEISTQDIVATLGSSSMRLNHVVEAAKEGSFCALYQNECNFVSSFVGCDGHSKRTKV